LKNNRFRGPSLVPYPTVADMIIGWIGAFVAIAIDGLLAQYTAFFNPGLIGSLGGKIGWFAN
jgi:uncharacterized membrane protein YeaQ/YmgE (transglycosylase-associated protein family)